MGLGVVRFVEYGKTILPDEEINLRRIEKPSVP
jgi:hypothetical protein